MDITIVGAILYIGTGVVIAYTCIESHRFYDPVEGGIEFLAFGH